MDVPDLTPEAAKWIIGGLITVNGAIVVVGIRVLKWAVEGWMGEKDRRIDGLKRSVDAALESQREQTELLRVLKDRPL